MAPAVESLIENHFSVVEKHTTCAQEKLTETRPSMFVFNLTRDEHDLSIQLYLEKKGSWDNISKYCEENNSFNTRFTLKCMTNHVNRCIDNNLCWSSDDIKSYFGDELASRKICFRKSVSSADDPNRISKERGSSKRRLSRNLKRKNDDVDLCPDTTFKSKKRKIQS